MTFEVPPPKYAVVINSIQRRIEDGTYSPGAAIPSETHLMAEFNVSRPTAVRALGILQQQGWIESQQGKGRFVRARPPSAARGVPERLGGLFDSEHTAGVELLRVGPVMASGRAAVALDVDPETPVIARRRLVVADIGPIELGTTYVPVELASGTEVGGKQPLADGLLRHLTKSKGVEFDHVTERISARLPTTEEAELLKIGRRDPVLTVLMAVFDRSGTAQVAADVVIPASRHELEDTFPLPS